ncbi:type IV-A pilus assembly ATPase PilB [Vibrio sp. JC009]|uniref:type IV-A pilus assembly ATPase PilB n=1 Tax=Vibrio sp. JC009 TaxID=2912314 RepID=UPI0023AFCDE9|nr:type IV-A pilus assembly ATPase PilB [Vibrio sp. JC009]WED22353.1 type IV-A pilus assembly ATPase PilB [Vibrio sp. JC009]
MSSLISILCQHQLLTPEQSSEARTLCEKETIPAVVALNKLGYFTFDQLSAHISSLFSMPLTDIRAYNYEPVCHQMGLRKLICKHSALPVELNGNELLVAVSDPCNSQAEDDFRFATRYQIRLCLADYKSISGAIRHLYGQTDNSEELTGREIHEDELSGLVEASDETESSTTAEEDQAPVSRFISQVIEDAVRKGASDIHFEPYENHYRIRFRCDGILIETQKPAPQLARRLAARIKILSKLDIAERRIPQDGRIKLKTGRGNLVDLRVSTLPTLWGEKVVLRILDSHQASLDIKQLGFSDKQIALYSEALKKPQGMILITGPTGSGKTVSLYTGLNILNSPELNISTAEDPVEINLPGINQVQINRKIHFDFAQALRAFLRQDPDVVMVGEIRDSETAAIAIRAAQTGHLVLSTLHTNSAIEAVTRLGNLGTENFDIASSLSLVIAQRLVRRLCPHCKQKQNFPQELLKELSISKHTVLYQAKKEGCTECNGGYSGRVGIYEVINCDSQLRSLIAQGASYEQLETVAISSGMKTLKESGLDKLKQGATSYAEIQRVL